MSDTRYVQHVSGQGKQWEVLKETDMRWVCLEKHGLRPASFLDVFSLPKSEYVLVAPPEQWVDVTETCEVTPDICSGLNVVIDFKNKHRVCGMEPMYRFRKVTTPECQYCETRPAVFLVEKREP